LDEFPGWEGRGHREKTAGKLKVGLGRKVLEISYLAERWLTWRSGCLVSVLGMGWFGFHHQYFRTSRLASATMWAACCSDSLPRLNVVGVLVREQCEL
jgi:hypothetical protein